MFALFFCFFIQSVSSIPYVQKPIDQTISERKFSQDNKIHLVDSIEIDSLFNLGIVKTDKIRNNSVLVLDYRPFPLVKAIQLDIQKVTMAYGFGRGRGPGELINPTDFDITNDGNVWIADEPQSKILIFDSSGDLYDEWVIEFTPYKLAGNEYDMAIYGSFDPVVKLVDVTQSVIWTSDHIVENPRKWASAIAGFLLSDKNTIYNISNFTGELIALDDSGEIKYFRQLISDELNQEIFQPIKGLDFEAYGINRRNLNYAAADGFISDEKIHLLIQIYGEDSYQVIDVYTTNTGEYLYSYRLEESVRSITSLDNGTIVGIQPDRLLIWE